LPVQVVGKAGTDDIRHNRGSSGDGIQDHVDNCSLELRKNHFNADRVQLKHLKKKHAAIIIRRSLLRTRRKVEIEGFYCMDNLGSFGA
jgi:hypothetical protein